MGSPQTPGGIPSAKKGPLRFTWTECSEALGDLGLFLPLVVGISIACDLDLATILIFAGLMNIVSGWIFRQPIPVQPMKAIAAVAITEGMLKGELVASGLLIGEVLITLALTGTVERIQRWVPRPIVRGIQLGVGLKLVLKGLEWAGDLPWIGIDSLLTAGLVAATLLIGLKGSWPVMLIVFLAGFGLLFLERPEVFEGLGFSIPQWHWSWPMGGEWLGGLRNGALPQLPLTLLNSVVALCALSADYFPGRGFRPRHVATSVGMMNLLFVPLGGIPMCHGAGGLAAQYRFGARTGGSVIMLGILKVIAGVAFGGALLGLLGSYPAAILGPMLVLAGYELAKSAKTTVGTGDWLIVVVTAGVILGFNTLAGFLTGALVALMVHLVVWKRGAAVLNPGMGSPS